MRSSAITCEKESEVRSENDSEEEETYLGTAAPWRGAVGQPFRLFWDSSLGW